MGELWIGLGIALVVLVSVAVIVVIWLIKSFSSGFLQGHGFTLPPLPWEW
jgi:hypothetical protein